MCFFCFFVLFEGVSVTPVILATVRGEGRLRAAGRYIVSGESGESADEFQIAHFIYVFTAKIMVCQLTNLDLSIDKP